MSIVGTRPPLISEMNLYEPHHKVRLAIKPGITGMWQVSGRSDITDFEEVVRLDNGKRILEMPFNEVLKSGKPDFPFCLGWANHSWSNKTWQKLDRFQKDTTFIEQLYPGIEDYKEHFYAMLPAFKDERYITVDDKPLFLIYAADQLPNAREFINTWNCLAIVNR